MKTIEERAEKYGHWADQIFNRWDKPEEHIPFKEQIKRAFIAGAESQHAELTRWHNPFVKDMPKGNVLVKYIAVGRPNEPYYTVGRREPSGVWSCENELATSHPRFEIVGWHPIHE